MTLQLPYPPSINDYYGRGRNGVYLKEKAKKFRRDAVLLLRGQEKFGHKNVHVHIEVHPPAERGDIDNIIKPTLDALEAAGIIDNDRQVNALSVVRRNVVAGGRLDLVIKEF